MEENNKLEQGRSFLTEKQKFVIEIEKSLDNTIMIISAGAFGLFSFYDKNIKIGKWIILFFFFSVLFIFLSQLTSLKSFEAEDSTCDAWMYDKLTGFLNFFGRLFFVIGLIISTSLVFVF